MAALYHELTKLLLTHGCYLLRQAKGSHEIWYSPANGRNFTVSRSISSKHLANEILKQAGLPKGF